MCSSDLLAGLGQEPRGGADRVDGPVVGGLAVGGQREQVLRALVEQVVVPNTARVAEDSRRMEREISRLLAEPTLSTLRAAQAQWQRALLSWKRADVFRSGPIAHSNSLLRAMFWPVRTGAIEALLQSAESIDEAGFDADRKSVV